MADVDNAAAQREARRRRILENSEKRMQKIMGLTKSESQETSNATLSEETMKNEGPFPKPQEVEPEDVKPAEEKFTEIRQRSRKQVSDNPEPERSGIVEKNPFVREDTTTATTQTKTADSRQQAAVLSMLALAVVILFRMGFGFLFLNNVLFPFILLEIVIISQITSAEAELSGLLKTALMLSGLPQQTLQSLTKKYALLQRSFQDFCIYVFFFLIFHQLLELF